MLTSNIKMENKPLNSNIKHSHSTTQVSITFGINLKSYELIDFSGSYF